MKKNLSVTGRTVLAPNLPSNPMRESKLNHSQPISQKNSKELIPPIVQNTLKSTDKTTISSAEISMTNKESMIKLKKQIEKLVRDTKDLTLYNHSSIFNEINILRELQTLVENFQTFYHDTIFYYKSVKAVEDSLYSTRVVPNAALKSSSLAFNTNWKRILFLYSEIEQKGPESLSLYIDNKFKMLHQIIVNITQKQEKNIHKEKITEASTKLKEMIISEAKYVQLICNEKNKMKDSTTNIIETLENDMKKIEQQFEENNYHIFSKCTGITQGELNQYKTQFISNCEEIITEIRAFFSFDKDIETLQSEIKPISDHIDMIVSIAELPPSPIRTISPPSTNLQSFPVQSPIITYRSLSKSQIDTKRNKKSSKQQFTVSPPPPSSPATSGRPFSAPQQTQGTRPNVPILTQINPKKKDRKTGPSSRSVRFGADKMNQLKDFLQIMRNLMKPLENPQTKDLEEDFQLPNEEEEQEEEIFVISDEEAWQQLESLKQKIPQLVNDIKEKEERLQEGRDEIILQKQHEFKVKEEDLKRKLEEMHRRAQIADEYAHSLEEEIKTLEESDEHQKSSKTLQRAVTKMSQIFSRSEKEFPFMKDTETEAADKMSLFVIDRKCKTCLEHEKFEYELMQKLGVEFLGDSINDNLTLEEKIKQLPIKIDQMKSEIMGLKEEIDHLEKIKEEREQTILKMKIATEEIRHMTKDIADSHNTQTKSARKDNEEEEIEEEEKNERQPIILQRSLSHRDENIKILNESNDMAEVALTAFETMKDIHDQQMIMKTQELEHKHQQELREIADALDLCDDETVSAITNCVKKVKLELSETKTAVSERDKILKRLDSWMRDHIINMNQRLQNQDEKEQTMEQKFQDLMFQFDETPNPLSKPFEELSKERRKTRSELEGNILKMAKIFPPRLKTPQIQKQIQNLKTLKPAEIMALHESMINAITGDIGNKDSTIMQQRKTLEDSTKELQQITNKVLTFLEKPKPKPNETENEEESLYDLTQKLGALVDEVCNSGNENFVSKEMLTKAISPIKSLLNGPANDPRVFIPQLVSLVEDATTTIETMGQISTPLSKAFQGFDFTKKPAIDDPQFITARDYVFHVNSLIRNAQATYKDKVGSKAIDVLSQFISITSSMFSLVAMLSFGTPGAKIAN